MQDLNAIIEQSLHRHLSYDQIILQKVQLESSHLVDSSARDSTFFTDTYDCYSSVTKIIFQLPRSKACHQQFSCIQSEPYFIIQTLESITLQCSSPLHYIPNCFSRTDYLEFLFFHQSTILWNPLPNDLFNEEMYTCT